MPVISSSQRKLYRLSPLQCGRKACLAMCAGLVRLPKSAVQLLQSRVHTQSQAGDHAHATHRLLGRHSHGRRRRHLCAWPVQNRNRAVSASASASAARPTACRMEPSRPFCIHLVTLASGMAAVSMQFQLSATAMLHLIWLHKMPRRGLHSEGACTLGLSGALPCAGQSLRCPSVA